MGSQLNGISTARTKVLTPEDLGYWPMGLGRNKITT